MYYFVLFQKGLHSVFDESSQTAWFFFAALPTFIVIPTNSHKTLTNYIQEFSGWITLSTGENRMKICAVIFEFIASRQTDRQTRRRTLFYNMYRYLLCVTYLSLKPKSITDIAFLPFAFSIKLFPYFNDNNNNNNNNNINNTFYSVDSTMKIIIWFSE